MKKRLFSCILALVLALTLLPAAGAAADEPQDASIFVQQVPGTDGDFMRGADVSSLLANLRAGAVYYDFDGAPLGEGVDDQGPAMMALLADCGFNWIRLRVWNDPYDADGHGYGGGDNDLEAAKIMGRWATDAGLRVLIDFHYSDFWADPGKQFVPKAWAGMDVDAKAEALGAFTQDSLRALLDAGVDVGMVQVGNETNGYMCGEKDWDDILRLMDAGTKAVRAVDGDILVALHFTNPETEDRYASYAKTLDEAGVDYDIFASSFYPDGAGNNAENLAAVLKDVADAYGKKVMVVETSWQWYTWPGYELGADSPYPGDIQGQADELTDAAKAVTSVGELGVGLFYWEPAWTPVRSADGLTGEARDAVYSAGWASPYADEYDPGIAWGTTGWADKGFFDHEGHPLDTLRIFQYFQTGAVTQRQITGFAPVELACFVGQDAPALPETVTARYNDRTTEETAVTWTDGDQVDTSSAGTYTVHGEAAGMAVTAEVTVSVQSLLENPGFEDEDMSMYVISDPAAGRTTDDPYDGAYSLHFWSADPVDFTAEQTVTLQPGDYLFTFQAQGGDVGDGAETYAYVRMGDETLTDPFNLTGWVVWTAPQIAFAVAEETEVTVGVSVTAGAGAWGTIDEFSLGLNG